MELGNHDMRRSTPRGVGDSVDVEARMGPYRPLRGGNVGARSGTIDA